MKDKISIERVKLLHPKVTEDAYNCITAAEKKLGQFAMIRVVQGFRSFEEQAKIYNQGRTTPGKIVSNARPGSSLHNYGLALDFAIMYDKDKNGTFETLSWDIQKDFDIDGQKDWDEVSSVFVSQGWTWGGSWRTFKDYPHVEKSFGLNWRDYLWKYNNKIFIDGTKYIKI
jgi:peptidoglycan L-alanyl-D-glutamate endopeptidase CwlK